MRFFILAALLLGGSLSAQAAIIDVNITDDTVANDGHCSLREAVISANMNAAFNGCLTGDPGHDDIQLPAGNYVLDFASYEDINLSGDLDITEDLAIIGATTASTIIEGGAGFNDRLIHVLGSPYNATVELFKLTLRNGNALNIPPTFNGGPYGGAVLNDGSGTLTLAGVVAEYNTAQAGGGIFSRGGLISNDSQVCNNLAKFNGTIGNAWGGGIFSLGNTTLSYSKVCLNRVEVIATTSATPPLNSAYGGGIYSLGNTTIDHSEVSDNTAEISASTPSPANALGGGIYIENNTLTVQGSEIHHNTAKAPTTTSGYGAKGAGIYVGLNGSAQIGVSSHIAHNTASAYESHGGGIYHGAALKKIIVDNSTIDLNEAVFGGGIYAGNTAELVLQTGAAVSHNIAKRNGGGVYLLFNSTLNAINATIRGNQANGISALWGGGGIYMHPFGTVTASLSQSTVDNNTTVSNGGGIFVGTSTSTLSLTNSTVSTNHAAGDGGGIYNAGILNVESSTLAYNSANGNGGGIHSSLSTILHNTLVAFNSASDLSGTFTSGNYNLICSDPLSVFTPSANDQEDVTPLLGPLTYNGGITYTHALLPGSPGIDEGYVTTLTEDQRGFPRPVNLIPDIGAFEATGGNHAPLLDTSGSPFLGVIQEDDTNPLGLTITEVIGKLYGFQVSDMDGNSVGLAFVGFDHRGAGVWQYDPTGTATTWTDFGTLSDSTARLLEPTARIRFLPAPDQNSSTAGGDPWIRFRAWDQTSGSNGAIGNTSVNGDPTAFSTAFHSATIYINPVNDLPSFTPGGNQSHTGGTSGPQSVAGWATAISPGSSSDEITQPLTFTVSILSDPNGILSNTPGLSASTGNLAYPLSGNNGVATLSVYLNDGMVASSGAVFTITVGGNSAPVLDNSGVPSFSTIGEDPTGNPGDTVSSLIAGSAGITDANGNTPGLAIIGADTSHGAWQYNLGSTWLPMGGVSSSNARLLAPGALIRFVPNLHYNSLIAGNPVITFRAWDQTSGVNGGIADTSANGGATPFSTAIETADIEILAVNDPPMFTPGGNRSHPAGTSGPQSVTGWATGIGPGGGSDESGQTVTFLSTIAGDPAGILSSVSLSASGALSYTLTGNSGTASVSVSLQDNGLASPSPNLNLSPPATFTITVAPPLPPVLYPVNVSVLGNGQVTSAPVGILCGAQCAADFPAGSSVTLTAQPGAGQRFVSWQGACSGTVASFTLAVDSTKSCSARFEPIPPGTYPVKVSVLGNGQVSSAPAGISCGADCEENVQANTQITLTAQAAAGSQFAGWAGDCAGTDETVSLTVDSAKHCTARFTVIPLPVFYPVRVSINGEGQVTSAPAGISCGADCEENVQANTQITLTAQAAAGSQFDGWAGDCAGTDVSVNLTVDSAKHCAARFTVIPLPVFYPVRVSVSGSGQVNSTPAGIACGARCEALFLAGSQITLNAQPGADSQFDGWAGDCGGAGELPALTVDTAKTCLARFVAVPPPVLWPEIALFDNGQAVESGGHSDFGTLQPGGAMVRAFTVRNLGQADLLLHTPVLSAPGFSLASAFPSRIAPGGEAVFLISFQAPWGLAAQQTIAAVLSFASNDNDEARFEIHLSAQVLPEDPQPAPEPTPEPTPEPEPDPAVELSAAPLIENRPPGTPAGRLFTRGGKVDETYTYRLVDGDSDAFFIQGDLLFTARRLDYEAQQVFSLEIESTDSQGRTYRQIFNLSLLPQSIPADEVVTGWKHTCALRNGAVSCWGWNNFGQATPPADLRAVRQLSAGTTHTCALLDTGALACWGNNQSGQASPPAGRDFIQASAGGQHSCALRANGQAVCWGYDFNGQARPPAASRFSQLATGGFHTCGLRADHSVECWGWNNQGQAAPPDTQDFARIAAGEYHTCGLTQEGRARCWGRNFHGQASPPDLAGLVDISAGEEHSCALHRDGYAVCWGQNSDGQATPPWDNREMAATRAGGYYTCGLYRDASLQCWGESDHGQAAPPATPPNRAPTGITLTPAKLSASAPVGSLAGTLSSMDLDTGDTHTYRLVADAEANALFSIEGDRLLTAAALPGPGEYRVRVLSDDGHNGQYETILVVYAE